MRSVFIRFLAAAYKVSFYHFMRLIIKSDLRSKAAYISYFLALSKGQDDAQPLLGCVLTKLSFCTLFHHLTIMFTLVTGGLWWTEGSGSGETSLPELPQNVLVRERGLGKLCSSAAYNRGRLTLFLTPFRAAYKAVNNRINTVAANIPSIIVLWSEKRFLHFLCATTVPYLMTLSLR